MGAQLILGAQQILMVLGAQGAQGAQTMNCTIAWKTFSSEKVVKARVSRGKMNVVIVGVGVLLLLLQICCLKG